MTTKTIRTGLRSLVAALALAGSVSGYAANSSVRESEKPAVEAAWFSTTTKNIYATSGGSVFNDNQVVQADLGVVVRGVSADIWTNYDTKKSDRNEHDITVSKTFSNDYLDVKPSIALWTLPHTSYSDAKLVGLAITPKKPLLGLDAKVSALKLWSRESKGTTIDFSFSKTYNLTDKLSLTANYTPNFNHKFYSQDSGIQAQNLGVNASYNLNDAVTLSGGIKRQFHNPSYKGGTSQTIWNLGFNIDLLKAGRSK